MSELKITTNTILNSILLDGLLVFGQAKIDSSIISSTAGAMAHGYTTNNAYIKATALGAHAEGYSYTYATTHSHTEIYSNIASGIASHAEGIGITAEGKASHAEGNLTLASGIASHAEGNNTVAAGNYSHAEGNGTYAKGNYAHAEGYSYTTNKYELIQGCIVTSIIHVSNTTTELIFDTSLNKEAFDIGDSIQYHNIIAAIISIERDLDDLILSIIVNNRFSNIQAGEQISKFSGSGAVANAAHVNGENTIATMPNLFVCGKNNSSRDITSLFIVGDGTASNSRRNAFTVVSDSSNSAKATVNGIRNVELGLPIGSITMWPSETTPRGWLLCDGSYISVSQTNSGTYDFIFNNKHYVASNSAYSNLLKVILYKYTTGYSGLTTLTSVSLPDFRGMFPVGAGEGEDKNHDTHEFALGYEIQIGEYTHQLTKDELASHNHKLNSVFIDDSASYDGIHSAVRKGIKLTTADGTSNIAYGVNKFYTSGNTGAETVITSTGNNTKHNNIPPYLGINFIIKYK